MVRERENADNIICNSFSELFDIVFNDKLPCEKLKLEWEFLAQKFTGRNPRKVADLEHIFVDYVNGLSTGTFVLGKDIKVNQFKIVFECDE